MGEIEEQKKSQDRREIEWCDSNRGRGLIGNTDSSGALDIHTGGGEVVAAACVNVTTGGVSFFLLLPNIDELFIYSCERKEQTNTIQGYETAYPWLLITQTFSFPKSHLM